MYTAVLIISVLRVNGFGYGQDDPCVYRGDSCSITYRLSAQLPQRCIVHIQSWLVFGDFFSVERSWVHFVRTGVYFLPKL